MSFEYTLANLLAKNEGAIAVIFVDETGETVDLAVADFTHYDMKIMGAYMGIYLRQMEMLTERVEGGLPDVLHIEKEKIHLFTAALPDGYHLVLVQRRPASVGVSRRTLLEARDEIAREIFG